MCDAASRSSRPPRAGSSRGRATANLHPVTRRSAGETLEIPDEDHRHADRCSRRGCSTPRRRYPASAGAYPRRRHRQGPRRSDGQGTCRQRRPARQADPHHRRRGSPGGRPRNRAHGLGGYQEDARPRRDEAGAARRHARGAGGCQHRGNRRRLRLAAPHGPRSDRRHTQEEGSACRSGPRRSRVADASTASCRDRQFG